MATTPSPYDVLGVPVQATPTQVEAAYKAAMRARRHSPQLVKHAYDELRTPHRRLRHDLLRHDLLGPEHIDVRGPVERALEQAGVAIDDRSVPLPTWPDLVDAGLETAAIARPLPAADPPPSSGRAGGPAPRDVVVPFAFPELP